MTTTPIQAPRVAYQGVAGAFSEAAARVCRGNASPVPAHSFDDVLALVWRGGADLAVIPVWNSTIGSVVAARRALHEYDDRVETVDEVMLPVHHCLLALPGATLGTLRAVGSHPAALAQCGRFLAENPQLTPCVAFDTAGAAGELAQLDLNGAELRGGESPRWYDGLAVEPLALGVIAARGAAERYGLTVVLENVQDDPDNETLFVVVRAREGAARW